MAIFSEYEYLNKYTASQTAVDNENSVETPFRELYECIKGGKQEYTLFL